MTSAELDDEMTHRLSLGLGRFSGVSERRVCGVHEDSVTMAAEAARRCLERSRYSVGDLDAVVCTPVIRLREPGRLAWEPSLAAETARALGARPSVQFDLINACAGMLTGILVLDRMIRSGRIRNGMVVSGEPCSTLARRALRDVDGPRHPQLASLTTGDAAACVIVDAARDTSPDRIHGIEMMTSAEFAHHCKAMPSPVRPGLVMLTDTARLHDTRAVRQWTALHAARPESFTDPTPSQCDYLIPHQVSTHFVQRIRRSGQRALGPMPPAVSVVGRYGNTASTSLFVALHDHFTTRRPERPERFLLVSKASGVVSGIATVTLSPRAVV
ncbi:3-oxoacyl-ACP synthase III family protein [Streptomyces sp. NPDC048142]|uniref:3-oxoacyl-ACP synthase III family protein n=1 Tax=Streptomyces sp. NPDC048142 TaxID=3365501 RepID=UPI00372167FA